MFQTFTAVSVVKVVSTEIPELSAALSVGDTNIPLHASPTARNLNKRFLWKLPQRSF